MSRLRPGMMPHANSETLSPHNPGAAQPPPHPPHPPYRSNPPFTHRADPDRVILESNIIVHRALTLDPRPAAPTGQGLRAAGSAPTTMPLHDCRTPARAAPECAAARTLRAVRAIALSPRRHAHRGACRSDLLGPESPATPWRAELSPIASAARAGRNTNHWPPPRHRPLPYHVLSHAPAH